MAPALEHIASREVHEAIAFVLLALVGLHVGGVVSQEVRPAGEKGGAQLSAPPEVRRPYQDSHSRRQR